MARCHFTNKRRNMWKLFLIIFAPIQVILSNEDNASLKLMILSQDVTQPAQLYVYNKMKSCYDN